MRYTAVYLFLFSLIFVLSCTEDVPKKHIPDVSDIKVELSIQRFEQALFALDTNNLRLADLEKSYPKFYPLYTQQIIQNPRNPLPAEAAIRDFLSYPMLHKLNDTVQQVYGDLSGLEADLEQLFTYQKYYLPQLPTPKVVTTVSEFAVDAFTFGDSLVGIGLDMFLGKDFPGYDPNFYPEYLRRQFRAEYIPVRLARAIAQNQLPEQPGTRLLDYMLQNGKALYLVDCLLPYTPDSLKMGYTQAQMDGAYANEKNVWARILEQNLLYSTDFKEFRKMITPSPNAPVIYTEAPGEIGNWVGWQIVKAYMRRFPETTIKELFAMQDAQKFLEAAKYRP